MMDARIYDVLVVSASERFRDSLLSLLPQESFAPAVSVSTVADAQREAAGREFDFIFVNSPLPDEDGTRFAADSCRQGGTVTVLFVAAGLCDQIYPWAAERGVFILPKPLPKDVILRGLHWMTTFRERLRRYERRVQPIQAQIEELRLVNRAKWLLISELKMTEPDAHRYITHQAMDRCVAKREVAKEIIRLYS